MLGGFIYVGRKLQVLDDLKKTTDTIKMNLKVTTDFLTRKFSDFNVSEIQDYSPYALTEPGREFLRSLGFPSVFKTHKADFFASIASENPKLKYDVENAAIKSIYALSDHDYMNFLKIFFYNNPKRSIENTAPTLGVYVRDQYLAEHPEITQ